MKYSKISGVLAWSGGTILLRVGQSIDDDHPLVTERGDIFDDEDPGASIPTRTPGAPVVERATSAPGEMRTTPGTGPGASTRVPRKAAGQ